MRAVADLVPQGARAVDVGTDHAMIPVWLAQTGRSPFIWATDIRPGPLQNAASLIDRTGTGDRIRLLLTDGLIGIGPGEADAVIIAGMGGETAISILAAAPWTRDGPVLILEPQSKRAELRRWLSDYGYQIERERLVKDAGRIYPVFMVRGGIAPAYSTAELHLGLLQQIQGDPLFREYLEVLRTQAAKAAPYDRAAQALVEAYDEIKGRL